MTKGHEQKRRLHDVAYKPLLVLGTATSIWFKSRRWLSTKAFYRYFTPKKELGRVLRHISKADLDRKDR
jgi:hypothetical protein